MERDPQFYIDKGFVDAEDETEFRIIKDAISCFGRTYKYIRRSFYPHPRDKNLRLWFPKFYENKEWSNVFLDNEETIIENCLNPKIVRKHMDKIRTERPENRLVFAHMKSTSGKLMYVFKGEYEIVWGSTSYENGFVHRRVSARATTYSSK